MTAKRAKFSPFTGSQEPSIALETSPLVFVLTQIRWPDLTTFQIDFEERVLRFGELLPGFPLIEKQTGLNLEVGPDGTTRQYEVHSYIWTSANGQDSVALSKSFISIYTRQYRGFQEFSEVCLEVLSALDKVFQVPIIDRIGLRYINRISNPEELKDIGELFTNDVVALSGKREVRDAVLHNSLQQATYTVDKYTFATRSGHLARGESVDPNAGTVPDMPTWVLDMDASIQQRQQISIEEALAVLSTLSDLSYDFFRLVTTNEFFKRFGVKP